MEVTNSSLPRSMRFARSGVNAVEADCTLRRWDSVNGSDNFTPSGANEIRIKISAGNSFLNGEKHYLYFKVTGATNAFFIDGHAGSFFDRVTIESNGQLLERLDRYALYSNLRKFYNGGELRDINNLNVSAGGGGLVIDVPNGGLTNNSTPAVTQSSLGQKTLAGQSRICCIELESGLFKNHHEKAIPMGSSELDLVLRLKQNNGAIVAPVADAPTWTISQPRFYAPCYQILNGDVLSAYREMMSQQGILIGGDTAKTYINSISNGASDGQSVQINDRSLSCKALVSILRSGTADSTKEIYSNTGFQLGDGTGAVTRYEYKINGESYPRGGIDVTLATNGQDVGRAYNEAIKALSKHGESVSHCSVDLAQFAGSATNTYTATAQGATSVTKGIMAVDLKKFDDDQLRMVGMNTAQNSSPNVLEITKTAFAAGDKEVTTFSIVEAFWSVSPTGTWSVAV
tara:strand:+ start:1650 stop:3023 length:1374 start_codon:yes stop_codon:yes gene_type:complete